MPELVGFAGHECEAFKMHLRFLNGPDASGLLDGVGELLGNVELEEAIHVAKGVDGVELVADDADALRKVHGLGVAQDAVAGELAVGEAVAMDAQVAEVAHPQMGAVEADGVDPLDVLRDVPRLDDLEILRANLGDDGPVLRGVGLAVDDGVIEEAAPDESIAVMNGAEMVDAFHGDGFLLNELPVFVEPAKRLGIGAVEELFANGQTLGGGTGL